MYGFITVKCQLSFIRLYFFNAIRPTFIKPVTQPVKNDSFFPSGDQANGAAVSIHFIEDVIFKYKNLEIKNKRNLSGQIVGFIPANLCECGE